MILLIKITVATFCIYWLGVVALKLIIGIANFIQELQIEYEIYKVTKKK